MGNFVWCPLGLAVLLFTLAPLARCELFEETVFPDSNVVGGKDAPLGRFPYACTIRRGPSNQCVCTGVLVHPRIVLTAAHCVYSYGDKATYDHPLVCCKQNTRDVVSRDMVFRSQARLTNCYSGIPVFGCDIAFLVLDKAAAVPVPRLPSLNEVVPRDVSLTALGWGMDSYVRQTVADRLQMADGITQCGRRFPLYSQKPTPADLSICTERSTQDLCRGDSGGPLIIANAPGGSLAAGNPAYDKVVGLDSYGSKACDSSRPQIFTKVSPFVGLIDKLIKELENEAAQEEIAAAT